MKGLPFDINARIHQSLQTKGNNADPKMQVVVARAKSSVQDSSYFTVENIRTTVGLTDISVATRRMRPYGAPDGLFAIHIDNGVAKVLERAYPDTLKLGWQDVFVVGPAKSVATTFDGYWDRHRKLWQLVTVEHPEIFWVDMAGILWTQHWNDAPTQEQLATGVLKVKAVRGWRNTAVRIQDTGVIAAYIKTDGSVYYRNFTEQNVGPRTWETETHVEEFTGVAVNLNLFLTNDYRTAIIIEDNLGQIHWFITGRNWAGMAIAPEKFQVTARASVKLIPLTYYKVQDDHIFTVGSTANINHLYANEFNKFKTVMNIDNAGDFGNTIKFTTMHRLTNLNPLDFIITDERGIIFNCINIIETGTTMYNWEYTAQFTNFNNAWGIGTLKYKALYTTNEAGYLFAEFSETFELTDLVPEDIPAPLVVSITNVADTGVLIEFDSPLIYGVPESIGAFTVTGHYWKDIYKEIPMVEIHTLSSVQVVDDTHILLTMTYPSHRIKRAHTMDIKYDSILGSITGVTYPLETFEQSFIPDITPLLNPAVRENFKITATTNIDLIEIIYREKDSGTENFTVGASAIIVLTKVGEINP